MFRRFGASLSCAGAAAVAEVVAPKSKEGGKKTAAPAKEPLTKEQQAEFLEKFKAKVAKDEKHNELDDFIAEEDLAPARATPSAAAVGRIQRGHEPLPSWLKLKIPKGMTSRPKYNAIKKSLRAKGLTTVCEEAKCPNIGECWGGGEDETATATIMLMGMHCTRGCRFCSVMTSKTPPPLDPEEPTKTAEAIAEMGVDYVVLTMVDRDDLPDGGAAHVAKCIAEIKTHTQGKMLVECLAGDYGGNKDCINIMANSGLDVYAHNIECVERITPNVRDRRAKYRQSLEVLEHAKQLRPDLHTKSSIMLGLGEEEHEVRQTLKDLRTAGVSFVTLGQYLQPSRNRLKVSRYAHPTEFEMWEKEALDMGFLYCASGPMVRSSYRAGEHYISTIIKKGAVKSGRAVGAANYKQDVPATSSGSNSSPTTPSENGSLDYVFPSLF